MKEKPIWFKFHTKDYLSDTMDLNHPQHGAYIKCMCAYYVTGKPLPAVLPTVYRMVGACNEAEEANTRFVLDRFFTLEAGMYRHARIDAELLDIAGRRVKAQASAGVRWDKTTPPTAREAAKLFDEATTDRNPVFDKTNEIVDDLIMAAVEPSQRAALAPCLLTIATAEREQNVPAMFEGLRAAITAAQVVGYSENQLMAARAWIAQHPVFNAEEAAKITDEEIVNLRDAVSFMQKQERTGVLQRPILKPGDIPAICFTDKDGNQVVQVEPPNPEQLAHIVAQIRAGNHQALGFGFGFLSPKANA